MNPIPAYTHLLPEMIRIYQETKSTRTVSKAIGISRPAVAKYLKRAGVLLEKRHQHVTTEISATDAAWLAGFIDGEGYIGMLKSKSDGHVTYKPRLTIVNSHKGSIEKVRRLAGGGCLTRRELSKKNPEWSDVWATNITGLSMRHIMSAIRPYCVVKASQIDLYFQFIASKQTLESKLEFKSRFEGLARNGFKNRSK